MWQDGLLHVGTYSTYLSTVGYQRYQGAYVYNKLVRFFAYTTLANWA